MSELSQSIQMAKEAAAKEAGIANKIVGAAKNLVNKKKTRREKIIKALIGAGVLSAAGGGLYALNKQASEEEVSDLDLAKIAAYDLANDAIEKLAYADQLFTEAAYVDEVYIKQAAAEDEVEIDSDGSALESFLQELDVEEDELEGEDE